MLSTKQIFFFFLLFLIISCDNTANEYKRIRGNALGTTYSVIIETEEEESLKEQEDLGFLEDDDDGDEPLSDYEKKRGF